VTIATLMVNAVKNGDANALERLVRSNKDVDVREDDSQPVICIASEKDDTECLELLIDARADVNLAGEDNATALLYASVNDHPRCVEALITAKANVNATKSSGATAIFTACAKGNVDCLRLLISAGANAAVGNNDGFSPLHTARERGHVAAAAMVLIATCDTKGLRLHIGNEHRRPSQQLPAVLSKDELLAAATKQGIFEAALPAAFARSVLGTLKRVASLTRDLRKEATYTKRLDVEGGNKLLSNMIKVQLMAVGLLRSLDPAELQRKLASRHGIDVREALVLYECKVLLADALLQEATDTQWSVIRPDTLLDTLRLVALGAAQFATIALYPPYAEQLADSLREEQAKARERVREDNPEEELPPTGLTWRVVDSTRKHRLLRRVEVQELKNEKLAKALEQKQSFSRAEWDSFGVQDLQPENLVKSGSKYFEPVNKWRVEYRVSDVVISACRSEDSQRVQSRARYRFLEKREKLEEEQATLAKRDYWLLQPSSRFYLTSICNLGLAMLLTFALPSHNVVTQLLLLVWTSQLVGVKARAYWVKKKLWCSDPLNL
jgi:hypothetical protein